MQDTESSNLIWNEEIKTKQTIILANTRQTNYFLFSITYVVQFIQIILIGIQS